MVKIEVLKSNQFYMSKLDVYSRDLTKPSKNVYKSFGIYYITFAMLATFYTSWLFIRENWSTNVKASLDAVKIIFAGIQCIGIFLNIGFKMNDTRVFHRRLQEIVDGSMIFSLH